jgi:protein-disulfide isomerase
MDIVEISTKNENDSQVSQNIALQNRLDIRTTPAVYIGYGSGAVYIG